MHREEVSRVEAKKEGKARSGWASMFSRRHWTYLPCRERALGFRDSFSLVLRAILSLLFLSTLLIGSPLKDPKTNSEILIIIRKECEDQKRMKKNIILLDQKCNHNLRCTKPGGRVPTEAGRDLIISLEPRRLGEAGPKHRLSPLLSMWLGKGTWVLVLTSLLMKSVSPSENLVNRALSIVGYDSFPELSTLCCPGEWFCWVLCTNLAQGGSVGPQSTSAHTS